MGRLILEQDRISGNLPAQPYLRLNREDDLQLSTSFQVIDLNGASQFNVNTFADNDSGDKLVYWDPVNKKFIFSASTTRQYDFQCDFMFSGGIRPASIMLRFKIPASTPIYFPFPEESPEGVHISQLATGFDQKRETFRYQIYANDSVREYGLQIEIASSFTLITHPSLKKTNVVVYVN